MRFESVYILVFFSSISVCVAYKGCLGTHIRPVGPKSLNAPSTCIGVRRSALAAGTDRPIRDELDVGVSFGTDRHRVRGGVKRKFLRSVWAFTRPHTIIGSAISIFSLFVYASPPEMLWSGHFWRALVQSAVPACFMNVFITGLNQITDVEIDKINKPYLPLASGELGVQTGIAIVLSCLVISIYAAMRSAWPLRWTLLGSGILGTMYSLEPFRLKRFPLLAAFCILVVRGSLVNMGFLLQARSALAPTVALEGPLNKASFADAVNAFPACRPITLFFAIFGVVIALMKDVPDVKGDQANNISSFSVKRGASTMFTTSWRLLVLLLAGSAVITARIGTGAMTGPKGLGVFALASLAYDVLRCARKVDADQPESVFAFYMRVWNIFYTCYLLLPLAR